MSWKAVGNGLAAVGKASMSGALWASQHPEVVATVASVAGAPAVAPVAIKVAQSVAGAAKPWEGPVGPRSELLEILQHMPAEAFGWFVAWTQNGYPDGLGGFKPDSRQAIEALKSAGELYQRMHG